MTVIKQQKIIIGQTEMLAIELIVTCHIYIYTLPTGEQLYQKYFNDYYFIS